jgi:hypothetical protein
VAGELKLLDASYKGLTALSAMTFVKTHATDPQGVIPCSAIGEFVLGVAGADVSTAQATEGKTEIKVGTLGIYWVVAGAAVALGAEIATDAAGKAITAVSTNRIVGICKKAAANAGELCLVELAGPGQNIKP